MASKHIKCKKERGGDRMKVTDYTRIADRYDQNPYRQQIEPDEDLKRYLNQHPDRRWRVLDLACGTGLYLEKQVQAFSSQLVDWHGLDASQEMLNHAEKRVPHAKLVRGWAEKMPYESESFDVVVNNYAFHHFTRKEEVMDEVTRVLRKNGLFKMWNIAVQEMARWWVYQYFPSARLVDEERFWTKDRIYTECSARGFRVELHVHYRMVPMPLAECVRHARNRDISVLTLIDDREYEAGLNRLEREFQDRPEAAIVQEFAELCCLAVKR